MHVPSVKILNISAVVHTFCNSIVMIWSLMYMHVSERLVTIIIILIIDHKLLTVCNSMYFTTGCFDLTHMQGINSNFEIVLSCISVYLR